MLLLPGLPAHYDQHLFRDNYKKFQSIFSHTFFTCTVYQMETYGTLPRVSLIQLKLVYNSRDCSSKPVY